jgi:hypothetical protein
MDDFIHWEDVRRLVGNSLYYSDGTAWLRTPFRDAVIEQIYRAALDLCDGQLQTAIVLAEDTWEVDSDSLYLSLTVDTDREDTDRLNHELDVKISELFKGWSPEERDDAAQRIYYGVWPVDL